METKAYVLPETDKLIGVTAGEMYEHVSPPPGKSGQWTEKVGSALTIGDAPHPDAALREAWERLKEQWLRDHGLLAGGTGIEQMSPPDGYYIARKWHPLCPIHKKGEEEHTVTFCTCGSGELTLIPLAEAGLKEIGIVGDPEGFVKKFKDNPDYEWFGGRVSAILVVREEECSAFHDVGEESCMNCTNGKVERLEVHER